VVRGVVRIEEAPGGPVGVRVPACAERGEDSAVLGERDRDVRAGGFCDPFGLTRCLLGRFFVAAHAGDEGGDGVGRRLPLRFSQLGRQPPCLRSRRDGDVPVAESRGHAGVEREHGREKSEAAFGPKSVDCRHRVERAGDEGCRPQVASGLRVPAALRRSGPQAGRQAFRMAERIRVGMDREAPTARPRSPPRLPTLSRCARRRGLRWRHPASGGAGQSKRGARFSRNAAMPSRASGVWLDAAMSSIA
jgi:hypothetical protein